MAQPSSFINTTRSRITAILKAMEDGASLQGEFNGIGGFTFTDTFDFSGENASTYDLTQAEFHSAIQALGRIVNAFQGQAVGASATALGDLYKAKTP